MSNRGLFGIDLYIMKYGLSRFGTHWISAVVVVAVVVVLGVVVVVDVVVAVVVTASWRWPAVPCNVSTTAARPGRGDPISPRLIRRAGGD